jgi:hypothetical protein
VLQRWSKRQNLRKRCVDADLGQPMALDSACLSLGNRGIANMARP